MKKEISIRDYRPEDVEALANIYYNTIHRINIQHYTEEQVNVISFLKKRLSKEFSSNPHGKSF